MSLKQELSDWIKKDGYVSLSDIHEYAENRGYRQSNAERCLRKGRPLDIQPVKNSKGYITGYKYESEILQKFRAAARPEKEDFSQKLF